MHDDDWHEWRRQGLGASDVAAVLGLSPWQTPYSLWAEKVGLVPREDTESPAMEFGKRAEVMLGPWFHDKTGLYVIGEQTGCEHPEHPWMRCTADGFVAESPQSSIADALGPIQFKTTSASPAEWDEQIPVAYQAQVTWEMLVTGYTRCWFGVLHLAFSRPDFQVYEFEMDPDDREHVLGTCTTFWNQHVVAGIPPEVDGASVTTDTLNRQWPDPEGSLDATSDLRILVTRIKSLKERIKGVEGALEASENELRAALGEHTDLIDGTDDKGRPKVIASWRPQTSKRLDTKAVRAEFGDRFDTTTETRVLRMGKS